MVIQISELKNGMEMEIKQLNETIAEKSHRILESKQNDASNISELKEAKTEVKLAQRRYNDLQLEYSQFKVKNKKSSNNTNFLLRNVLSMF